MVVPVTYTVTAKKWSGGWELHIAGVGVTQCRTLDSAKRQAQDYIETVLDEVHASVLVEVDLDDVGREVAAARRQLIEAQEAQEAAAAASRAAARHLRERGLSVSDSAYVMGISRGRVSQLVGSSGQR